MMTLFIVKIFVARALFSPLNDWMSSPDVDKDSRPVIRRGGHVSSSFSGLLVYSMMICNQGYVDSQGSH